MEKIFSNLKSRALLHIISRRNDITEKRQDLSPEEEFLQVACISMEKGKTIKPHKHIQFYRETDITQESWLILKGSIEIVLYDLDNKIIKKSILKEGDCLITFRGGHNFVVLEDDTIIYEFKTGPYTGKGADNAPIK